MSLSSIALVTLGALITAVPASAQEARSGADHIASLRLECCGTAEDVTVLRDTPIVARQTEDHRVWRYAVWGGLAGAAAGGLWGYALHANAEDWVSGSSAFLFTVPVGILAGGLAGAALAALTE